MVVEVASRILLSVVKQKPQTEHTKGVHIHFHSVRSCEVLMMPLWGNPILGPRHLDQLIIACKPSRVSKVRYFCNVATGVIFEDQNVRRLDIPMNNVFVVNHIILRAESSITYYSNAYA